MKENINKDYLRYLFHRTQLNLTRYQISEQDSELIRKIFEKFNRSENLAAVLYIFFNIKEFRNLSKYFIYIIKKIEDNVINFENLLQNLHTDSECLEKEILNYLSNPVRKNLPDLKFADEHKEIKTETFRTETKNISAEPEDTDITESELEEEETEFTKNYLELIQSDEKDEDVVYELPDSHTERTPDKNNIQTAFDLPENIHGLDSDTESKGENIDENIKDNVDTIEEESDETKLSAETYTETIEEEYVTEEEKIPGTSEEIQETEGDTDTPDVKKQEDDKTTEEDRIQLSQEIQEELNLFRDSEEIIEDEEEDLTESQPANELFLEYENEIREKNIYLEKEFNKMISMLNSKSDKDEERTATISSIIETSSHLENISRNISLEIISNIYQTITLSFEKISDLKYDISESTLNLFKKGLSLVLSLIKGDDYYGYKDILKTIENIRNVLIEEKQKRETYLKRLQEKIDIENNLNKKYPDDLQKEKLNSLKNIIKETEINFKSLEEISGEYQIYEALRSLSSSLNNFKEIVKISKELNMKKLVQMAESGYIFIKFLQNYRINPVTIETKEIFGYIIYNLKALVIGKPVDDIDLFISYLNDPVKIFSKTAKKKQ
ncbi:MAG TPA: hypothetical protein PKC91_04175 [Ignavibacteria bacterium]|nr:hypothetical protein [Ignavibacteria bacterium]